MRKAHKALLILFLIVAAGTISLLYQFKNSRGTQSNPDNALGIEVSDFNSMMNGLNVQVSQLQTMSSGSQANSAGASSQTGLSKTSVDYAQIAAPTVQGTLLQFDAERSALQSMLGQTQAADLTGQFYYRDSLSYSIVGGVYANVGLQTAHAANVRVTFYSLPSAQGTVLCTGTYQLGTVGPGAIMTVGNLQCGSGPTGVGSVTFQLEWD